MRKKHNILVKIEFIGKGPELNKLKKDAYKFDIESEFFGLVKNRRSVVKKWHFAIVPSFREPLGLVQGEMAIMDTLCLSSDIDGIPELYPKDCEFLKIRMIKNKKLADEFDNFQYCPSLGIFDKGYEPDVKDCSNKIAYLIQNPDFKEIN